MSSDPKRNPPELRPYVVALNTTRKSMSLHNKNKSKARKKVEEKRKVYHENLEFLKQAGCFCGSNQLYMKNCVGKKVRLCHCDIEANKSSMEDGGAWKAGSLGKPMNVENTRKLAKKANDKYKSAEKKLKCLQKQDKMYEREFKRCERALQVKREELKGATQLSLSEYFMNMEETDKKKFDDLALMCSCLQVEKLTDSDFPMKLVFLDKSGSMGCDKTSLQALTMGHKRAHQIDRGSSIVFLLAGPGETQFYFHRATDETPPGAGTVQLGCSTWFNEPIFLILKALASCITELVDLESASFEEPPLSVICLTDGMDNQSCQELRHLENLAEAISGIQTQEEEPRAIYSPLGTWKAADRRKMAEPEEDDRALIPVWLVWCAIASGASKLLEQGSKSVCIVDATYHVEATGNSMDLLSPSELPPLGATVHAKEQWNKDSTAWIVTARDEETMKVDLLSAMPWRTKGSMLNVDASTIQKVVAPEGRKRSNTGQKDPIHALALLHSVIKDTGEVLKNANESGVVPFEAGQKFVTEEFVTAVRGTPIGAGIKGIKYDPPPPNFLQDFIAKVGEATTKLIWDEEMAASGKLLMAVVKSLCREEDVHWAVLTDLHSGDSEDTRAAALLGAAARLGMVLGNGIASTERLRRLSKVLDTVLRFLHKLKIIRKSWHHGYELVESQRPALTAALGVLENPAIVPLARASYFKSTEVTKDSAKLPKLPRHSERQASKRRRSSIKTISQDFRWALEPGLGGRGEEPVLVPAVVEQPSIQPSSASA